MCFVTGCRRCNGCRSWACRSACAGRARHAANVPGTGPDIRPGGPPWVTCQVDNDCRGRLNVLAPAVVLPPTLTLHPPRGSAFQCVLQCQWQPAGLQVNVMKQLRPPQAHLHCRSLRRGSTGWQAARLFLRQRPMQLQHHGLCASCWLRSAQRAAYNAGCCRVTCQLAVGLHSCLICRGTAGAEPWGKLATRVRACASLCEQCASPM